MCIRDRAENAIRTKAGINPEPFLLRKSGASFYNTSPMDLQAILGDQDHIAVNLDAYIQSFSLAARDIFVRFKFAGQIEYMASKGLLYLVTEKFAAFDPVSYTHLDVYKRQIHICVLTAFSLVPKKALMRRCCLIHLKNSSTCHRCL